MAIMSVHFHRTGSEPRLGTEVLSTDTCGRRSLGGQDRAGWGARRHHKRGATGLRRKGLVLRHLVRGTDRWAADTGVTSSAVTELGNGGRGSITASEGRARVPVPSREIKHTDFKTAAKTAEMPEKTEPGMPAPGDAASRSGERLLSSLFNQ